MNPACWRYYFRFYAPYRYALLLAVLLPVAQSLVVLPIAFLIRYLFDHAIKQHDFPLMFRLGMGIIALYLGGNILALYGRNISLGVTKAVIKSIREEIVQRFYSFSQACYNQVDRSKLHTMAVQDTERLDVMSNALISVVIPAAVMSSGLLPFLFYLNWRLSAILVLTMLPLYLFSSILKNRVGRQVYDFQRAFEGFSKGISSVLQKMELTRIVGAERHEIKKQHTQIEHLREVSKRVAFLQALYVSTQSSVLSIAGILVLLVGGWATGQGRMTIGDLIAYYFLVGLIRTQVRSLIVSAPLIIEGHESLISLCDLLQTTAPPRYTGTQKVHSGSIILKDVNFQYGRKPILKNINIHIHPQEMVAVTGGNGAGKSSLVNLILGFYLPQQGELFIDNHPYSQIDLRYLRSLLGVVPQDPILFQGTIRENITYGLDQVTDKELEEASRNALADQFITRLPEGYKTVIGERGVRLSGGERQRIAIARALLRNPSILLLDEPMNHLDREITVNLLEIFQNLIGKRSIMVITHNKLVIRNAHRVYHIDHGRIDFDGPPDNYFQKFGESYRG